MSAEDRKTRMSAEDRKTRTACHPTCVGQLLVLGGFVGRRKLEEALRLQQEAYPGSCTPSAENALGRLLKAEHAVTDMEIGAVLQLQKRLRSLPLEFADDGQLPDSLQLTLGQLLLANGEITRDQLERALAEHQRQHRRLGEVLVGQKILSRARLLLWLTLQKKLVTAAAASVLLLGGAAPSFAGDQQLRFWDKLRPGKSADPDVHATKAVWGQPRPQNLSGLRTVQKAFGELVRSRDGSTVLTIGENGLEVTKRF